MPATVSGQRQQGRGLFLMIAAEMLLLAAGIAATIRFDLGWIGALLIAAVAASFTILIIRAGESRAAGSGNLTPAMGRYNRRILVASITYMLALFGAVWLSKAGTYPTPLYVAIAIAPALPVIGMIWAMARLLIEENDEYLRSRHTHHALVATGLILSLATSWGFLEQFNVVPHIPAYWVFPGWAICLGVSQCWAAVKP